MAKYRLSNSKLFRFATANLSEMPEFIGYRWPSLITSGRFYPQFVHNIVLNLRP